MKKVWYLPRMSRKLEIGDKLLFYQAREGVVGEATAALVAASLESTDLGLLQGLGLGFLTIRVELKDTVSYGEPVRLGPIVESLSFISNKQFWGHSLRSTPRVLSEVDFNLISGLGRSGHDHTAASLLKVI
jgi:hypothetical protein